MYNVQTVKWRDEWNWSKCRPNAIETLKYDNDGVCRILPSKLIGDDGNSFFRFLKLFGYIVRSSDNIKIDIQVSEVFFSLKTF